MTCFYFSTILYSAILIFVGGFQFHKLIKDVRRTGLPKADTCGQEGEGVIVLRTRPQNTFKLLFGNFRRFIGSDQRLYLSGFWKFEMALLGL